jgi:tetratricopeptide (TPR) repeat protein
LIPFTEKGTDMKRPSLAILLFLCSIVFAFPVQAQTALDTGLKEFKEENYEEALDHFIAARKADPASTTAAFYLGLTYKVMENYKDAVPNLRDAVRLSPPVKEALIELIDSLYQINDVKEAKEYIAIGEKENIMPPRLQFLKGLVALKEGSYQEAIGAFEKAKALDASLTQSADFQIANAYMRLGKYKDAQKRFRSVTLVEPTSDIAAFARDYDRILSEKLEKERPWRVSVGLNYKYDTNVVAKGSGGPGADQISGESGSGANMTFRLGYTAPFTFSTPYSLTVQYSLFGERWFNKNYVNANGDKGNLSEYNTLTNVIGILPGYNFKRLSLSLPVSFAHTGLQGQKGNDFLGDVNWYSDARYMNYLSVSPTATFMVSGSHFAEVSLGFLKKKYYETELHPAVDPDEKRDGKTWSGSLGWMYFFREGKGLLRLRYTYSEERTDGDNWSNRENRFAASLLAPIAGKLKGQVAGEAAFADYRHVNSVFNIARKNETYNGSISLIYEVFKDLEAVAQYSYIRDRSNISTYDYRKEVITLGLEFRY